MQGNTEQTVAAPIDQLPLFVKQVAVIPMRNYASSVEKGNNNVLALHIYPGADGSFNLLEDDGISNDYLDDKYASTLIEGIENKGNQKLIINPALGKYKGFLAKTKVGPEYSCQ